MRPVRHILLTACFTLTFLLGCTDSFKASGLKSAEENGDFSIEVEKTSYLTDDSLTMKWTAYEFAESYVFSLSSDKNCSDTDFSLGKSFGLED
jgi:hypothetical protein